MTAVQECRRRRDKQAFLLLIPAALALTACSSSTKTFPVTGDLPLPGASYQTCSRVAPGYEQIVATGQVLVLDASGATIARGQIGSPSAPVPDKNATTGAPNIVCTFPFTVQEVPAGQDFYKLQFGDKPTATYSATELAQPLHLTLGI